MPRYASSSNWWITGETTSIGLATTHSHLTHPEQTPGNALVKITPEGL